MKKTNFFKIVMTLVLAFVVTGAFAQWVPSTTEATDSVTVNVEVPYYVEPDAYFNPLFAAPNTDVVSTFDWTIPAGITTNSISDVSAAGADDGNYVTLTFNATGNYTLTVEETAPSGGCSGTPVTLSVEAIDSSSIAYTPSSGSGIIGEDSTFCASDLAADDILQVTFTTSVDGTPSFTLDYTYSVDTLEADGTTWNSAITPVDNTGTAAVTGINTSTYDLNEHSNNFAVLGNKTTRYVYTISGVTDRISRKSDYLTNLGMNAGAWTLYDSVAETITITVHPAPVTGPIYHISNMWAN